MRNMRQGTTIQLAPLVSMMEALNRSGCNYSLDVMVRMDNATIHYYDIQSGTGLAPVVGTSMTVLDDDVAWDALGCSGAEAAQEREGIGIAPDMVVEFEHYVNVLDGIRCTFHKVDKEAEEAFYDHHGQIA